MHSFLPFSKLKRKLNFLVRWECISLQESRFGERHLSDTSFFWQFFLQDLLIFAVLCVNSEGSCELDIIEVKG